MAWQLIVHPEAGIVETVYADIMGSVELLAAAKASVEAARQQGFQRLLGNCTRLSGGHSFADLYHLAAAVQADPFARTLREAVLATPGGLAYENARFYETTCFNRGLLVRLFVDRAAALEWLRQS